MRRLIVIALVVCCAGGTFAMAQRPQIIWLDHPPWAECPKPGTCFASGGPDDVVFYGIVDEENEWLIIGPIDNTKYFTRITPVMESPDHVSNVKAPVYYCVGPSCDAVWNGTACEYPWTEECLKANGFMSGTGMMTIGVFNWLYDEAHGEWWQGCPAIWTVHGTVYDGEDNSYALSSVWHFVPSPQEPEFCTEDQLYCWPCRTKTLDVEISPK